MLTKVLFGGNTFTPLPQRALFWHEEKSLLISDVHLGKVGHFRKNGIQVPSAGGLSQSFRIKQLLLQCASETLYILGDLVHAGLDHEWQQFLELKSDFPTVNFVLIRGNHDRLPAIYLKEGGVKTYPILEKSGIVLSHEPIEDQSKPCISGHIHPAMILEGKGKQHARLPCFYFSEQLALLPAFGSFTGSHAIKPKKNDRVFVIVGETLMEV